MKTTLVRAIVVSFVAVTFLFFILYRPAAYRAEHAEAVLLSLQGDLNAQEQLLKLEPQIAATERALTMRRQQLLVKCRPHCSIVQTKAAEIAGLRSIAKSTGLVLLDRTLNSDWTLHLSSLGTLRGSLKDLDDYTKLPMPIQISSVTFTAQGDKVKMDVRGSAIQGGM